MELGHPDQSSLFSIMHVLGDALYEFFSSIAILMGRMYFVFILFC